MKSIKPRPACLMLMAAFAAAPLRAAAPDHDELAGQQMSVRELMRLDTALALEQARDRLRQRRAGHPPSDAADAPAQEGGPRLLAIYGVGKKLLAEVTVGERTLVYIRGRAWAIGVKAGPSAYRLRNISGTCVHLAREGEEHTLCLHPDSRSAK